MNTIVFVHGTGVREPAYTSSFNVVQQTLNQRLGAPQVRVETCYWGGTCGSQLFLEGKSIPEIDESRAVGEDDIEADYDVALEGFLYDDPFAELELLAMQPESEAPPGEVAPGFVLCEQLEALTAAPVELAAPERQELSALLAAEGIGAHLATARDDVLVQYRTRIENANEMLGDYRLATIRAIVARAAQCHRDASDSPASAAVTGIHRERIIELLLRALGEQERSVTGFVKEKGGRLISRIATWRFRRRRGRYSEAAAPFGADVIFYQTRPQPIRTFIRETIAKAAKNDGDGCVSVIAHSLGGIATFDALIETPIPEVRHLITVGSQVPLLYELGALGSLPVQRDPAGKVASLPHALPTGFPRWLNIFDPRDFLSYRAEGIFGNARVRDVEVDNRRPFPESHSAYWYNTRVWDAIIALLAENSANG